MYRGAIFTLILVCACMNCFAIEADESITQFNVKCPAQKLGPVIDNSYHECHNRIIRSENNNSCERFLEIFKELMPKYDCARSFDISGAKKYVVPAIWLLGPGQFMDYHTLVHDLVFEKKYSGSEFAKARKDATALFFSEEFKHVLDAGGEVYEDEWKAHEEKNEK